MLIPQTHTVEITTDASGAATAYTPPIYGPVWQIHYAKTDFDNGSTFTITANRTGQNIWTETGVNASTMRATRQPTHTQAGVAISGGTDLIVLANDLVKIVISGGGNTKTGTFYVIAG